MRRGVFLYCKIFLNILISLLIIFFLAFSVSADSYLTDLYFTVPDSVYTINERIELKGYIYQNFTNSTTNVSTYSAKSSATVNFTILYGNSTKYSNYTFTTDSSGAFYSGSNYYTNTTNVTSPSVQGTYKLRAQYINPNNETSVSEFNISVVNQTLDTINIHSDKAVYNPSESVVVELEAIREIGDKIIHVGNVSLNGTMKNSEKTTLASFSCTTGNNGKCEATLTAPSTYGDYILEIGNFKTFSSFTVIPFSYNLYIKDNLNSLKNVFSLAESAKIEVKINNASSSDSYTFSGYITDSDGNSVKSIDSATMNSDNSFTNSFSFTVDSLTFGYGNYLVYVTVVKSGDGNITSVGSFKVQDWILSTSKKVSGSGFEYEYSTFPNKTLRFEASPTFRSNGSVIANINSTSFNITIEDELKNVISSTNASWNASCGKSGCYEYSLISPLNTGKYFLTTILSYSGDLQKETKIINVVTGVMSGQSTDKDGNLKELFSTNEYAYISLTSYNQTSSSFNLTDAEIFLVSYMNGTEFTYNQTNYSSVNLSNSVNEWGWNTTLQRIKIDVPKAGGVYNIYIFGNNRTLGTLSRIIVNPFDFCASAKNTPGTVSSGYYYVKQFKTSDTIYYEMKITQANNPLGKATAANASNSTNSTTGIGSACTVDTTTKQVVSNATITIVEVRNLESGSVQSINSSASSCTASDSSGGYSCTIAPSSSWDGGINIVKFNVVGTDGSSSAFYSSFESRAFYMYGYTSNWQNNPESNITLNVQLYEAGNNWWGGGGSSGGISGSVSLKRIEYLGSPGEWIWPPVDSGYNVTNVSSATITAGSGSLSLPVSQTSTGSWKTGYYRAVLQGTKTATGESDYGYAYFAVKLWDVYGTPIDCTSSGCNYKSYFNSRENITMYITLNKAGNWNNYAGGQSIYGNVTVRVKKIEECKSYPCKELNSSQYTSTSINVNSSSPWYWNGNSVNQSNYLIYINKTSGSWNSGWYSVILDVNGSDAGYSGFNAIAFYVESTPTNSSGLGYKYSIRGNQTMHFNVTTTKNYKWNSYGGTRYNQSDYINTTINSAVLRVWDSTTQSSKEYNYPTNFNITPLLINNGNSLINVSYNNGSWPTGYYWGEITLNNSDNETSSGYLSFAIQPFRVSVSSSSYNVDSDLCINSTISIYDSDWSISTLLAGNYSITSVYEDVWGSSGYSRTTYTNYTNSSFNATANATFCPNNGSWSSGNWGGYHSLNIVVKDNSANDNQTGWLSFRTVPFVVSWNPTSLGNKRTNANVNSNVTLNKSTGGTATGNLSRIYQWRYDNYQSTLETYRFVVNSSSGNCDSAVSSQCTVNGTANITIYAPSNGWKVGYNYIQSDWNKQNDAQATINDYSGIYFEGREIYNGAFSNYLLNNNWKYYYAPNENLTVKLTMQDDSYAAVPNLTISGVSYSLTSNSCAYESCRTYTSASFSPTTVNGSGVAILQINKSGNWTKGEYYIKAVVGGVTVTGGSVRVKDFTAPNITITNPINNATYNSSISFSATTSKASTCNYNMLNYNTFSSYYCAGWNTTNSSNSSTSSHEACNTTKYNYNGSTYTYESVSNSHHSYENSQYNYSYCTPSSCSGPDSAKLTNFISTGGTSHTFTINITGLPTQHYGINMWCYDEDYNSANSFVTFKVNSS